MIDLGGQPGLAADAKRFFHRFYQLVSFAADVRNVFAFVFRGDFAQLDQLFGLGEERGWIDQRGGDAERPGFHLLANKLAHAIQLLGRGRFVFKTDDVFANRSRADERRDVLRDAVLLEISQSLGESRPRNFESEVALASGAVPLHLVAERAHRSLAEDLGGHTLAKLALRAPVRDQGTLGVREHVDEARSYSQPGRIDDRRSSNGFEIADRSNSVAFDSDVSTLRGAACSVVDGSTTDYCVECGGLCGPGVLASLRERR